MRRATLVHYIAVTVDFSKLSLFIRLFSFSLRNHSSQSLKAVVSVSPIFNI